LGKCGYSIILRTRKPFEISILKIGCPDLNRRPCGLQPGNSFNSKIKEGEIRFSDINKDDFIVFWTTERKKRTTEYRANRLYTLLSKYLSDKSITEENLRNAFYQTTNRKSYVNAVRVLLDYLKVRKLMSRSVVNEILEQPFLTCIKSNKREIYLKDEEVKEAYEWIKQKWDDETVMLFELIVYSGIRLKHALRMLKTFDYRKLEFNGDVARYPMEGITTGEKQIILCIHACRVC